MPNRNSSPAYHWALPVTCLKLGTSFGRTLKGLLQVPPAGDIKNMKGYEELYRLRIGTFRILFNINYDEKIIYIQAIGNRGDIYK
ncbi:type II toxin-antitoxin system RelE/ParE family toxin [Microbacteriaceae bacterium 4G12]